LGDLHRNAFRRHLLDEDGEDLAEMLEGHRDLVAADAGITGGVDGEKGHRHLRLMDAFRDFSTPILPSADPVVVDPDLMAARFKIGLEAVDQLAVVVVTVAEKDPERPRRPRRDRWSGNGRRSRGVSGEAFLAGVAFPLGGFGFPDSIGGGAVGAFHGGFSFFEMESAGEPLDLPLEPIDPSPIIQKRGS
jgi:hypothetical protein